MLYNAVFVSAIQECESAVPFQSFQSCLTLCDPVDRSPPGSSAHVILQARNRSGLPCSPPGDLSDPGIEPQSPVAPALQGDSLPLSQRGSPSSTIVTLFRLTNASPFSMLK